MQITSGTISKMPTLPLCVRKPEPLITVGFIHITYLMQGQVSQVEVFIFPYGPLSALADTSVSLGSVKISIYNSLKGADPCSETVGAKCIHTESFGGCFFSQVSSLS